MRIAIVGGSIAGLSLAWALKDKGVDVTVYERSPGHLSHNGAGVMLAPTVAEELGIRSRPVKQRLFFDQNLDLVWQHPVTKNAVQWSDVYNRLRQLSEGVPLCDGSSVSEIREDPPGVLVGDRWHETDFVVGADGIGSLVRQTVAPEFEAEYLGYMAIRGVVPRDRVPDDLPPLFSRLFDDSMAQVLLRGEHVTLYGLPSDPAVLNWMWYRNTPASALGDFLTDHDGHTHRWSIPPHGLSASSDAKLREEVKEKFPLPLQGLVEATDDLFLQPVYCGSAARSFRDKIALIGDAAHLAVPHAGAGVSLALRDAQSLAETLVGGGSLESWASQRRAEANSHLDMAIRAGRYMQTPGRDWQGWTSERFDAWWAKEIVAGERLYFER